MLYAVQLALNLAWSLIFFGLRQPGLAMAEIALCWRRSWLPSPPSGAPTAPPP